MAIIGTLPPADIPRDRILRSNSLMSVAQEIGKNRRQRRPKHNRSISNHRLFQVHPLMRTEANRWRRKVHLDHQIAQKVNRLLMKTVQMTMLLNRIGGRPDELALIRSEPISMQWTNELRRSIGLHPSCKLLRELLSLDLYTRTVVYPFLIKGWSASLIADRLRVPLITIEKQLEIGREQLKRKLAEPVRIETERERQE